MDRPETAYHPPPDGLWVDFLRFPPGNVTYRARGTPDCLLLVGVGGCGRLHHEHGQRPMRRGDVALLMPDALHHYGAEPATAWEVWWSHFLPSTEALAHAAWPELAPGIRFLHLEDPLLEEVACAMGRGRTRRQGGSPLARDLAQIAVNESLLLCGSVNPEQGAWDPRVRQAIEVVSLGLDRTLRIAEIAGEVGLSASRLSRLFRSQTGSSIQQFIEGRRLGIARQRLALTSQPISRISAELGFTNPFYFSRRFRRLFHASPSAYRLQAQRLGPAPGPAGPGATGSAAGRPPA